MHSAPPANRRSFISDWDETIYLLGKLSYWFWEKRDERSSRPYATRLEAALRSVDPDIYTQRGAEAWALVFALRHDWRRSLAAKRREIKVMRRLLSEGVLPSVVSVNDLVHALRQFMQLSRMAGKQEGWNALLEEVVKDHGLKSSHRVRIRRLLESERRRKSGKSDPGFGYR